MGIISNRDTVMHSYLSFAGSLCGSICRCGRVFALVVFRLKRLRITEIWLQGGHTSQGYLLDACEVVSDLVCLGPRFLSPSCARHHVFKLYVSNAMTCEILLPSVFTGKTLLP